MDAALGNIHIIVGEDDFLTGREALKTIDAALGPGCDRSSCLEKIDCASCQNAESQLAALREFETSIMTPPFFEPVKVSWLRDAGFLPSGGKQRLSQEVKSALEKFAQNLASDSLPENQTVVITAPKLMKTSVFAKTLLPVAQIKETGGGSRPKEKQAAAQALAETFAKELGLKFDSMRTADAFIGRTGFDSRTILSELGKMRDYLGQDSHTIKMEDVSAITSSTAQEPEFWLFTDAFAMRNIPKICEILAAYRDTPGAEMMLTTATERFTRLLLAVKTLPADAPQIAAMGLNDWRYRSLMQQASRFTENELLEAHRKLMEIRTAIVSSGADGMRIFETRILELVSPKRKAVRR